MNIHKINLNIESCEGKIELYEGQFNSSGFYQIIRKDYIIQPEIDNIQKGSLFILNTLEEKYSKYILSLPSLKEKKDIKNIGKEYKFKQENIESEDKEK